MGDSQIVGFAEEFLARAESFADTTAMHRSRVRLGRESVDLSVPAGPAPRPDVLQAFWPSDADASRFSLTIVDDRAGDLLPEPGLPPEAHHPLGVVAPELSSPFRVAFDEHTRTISVFDPATGRCATWIRSFQALPYWAAATPFRLQLSWMADTFDGEFVHGAAIVRGGRAVMLGGPSGSGKSSMSLLAAAAGDALVSDDFLLYEDGHVHAVYTRAKLHLEGVEAFGADRLAVLPIVDHGEKRIIDLGDSRSTQMALSAPLVALVLPTVGGTGSTGSLSPMPAGRALLVLAPPSLSGLLGGLPSSLSRLRSLARSVPCYQWILSGDRSRDLARLETVWTEVLHGGT